MLECLILGDSIAVGTAKFREECVSYAKGGWNSLQYNRDFLDKAAVPAQTVIISLGSNDHENIRTLWELQKLRRNIKASKVFWILPAIKPDVQEMIKIVAKDYGDTILPITRLTKDGIHPSWAGYKELAEKTR